MCDDICSAVSLRTLAGSSSGPVALFWLRFFNCLIIPFVPISRGGMQEYNEGSITGMGYLSLVKTEVNWLLRAFALSRSFVIGLSFTLVSGLTIGDPVTWYRVIRVRTILEECLGELTN